VCQHIFFANMCQKNKTCKRQYVFANVPMTQKHKTTLHFQQLQRACSFFATAQPAKKKEERLQRHAIQIRGTARPPARTATHVNASTNTKHDFPVGGSRADSPSPPNLRCSDLCSDSFCNGSLNLLCFLSSFFVPLSLPAPFFKIVCGLLKLSLSGGHTGQVLL